MRNKKALYVLLLTLLLTVSILAVPAIADAGNYSGSSDYGGSSSDWGSSSDYSYDYDYDDDYYDDSEGGGIGGFVVAGVIIVIILFFVFRKGGGTVAEGGEETDASTLQPMAELKAKDENFSEAAMQEKISNLYVQMQEAWEGKDFEPMRPHMTDALYNQFARQLEELKRSDCTNFIDRIAVLSVELRGWREDEVNDAIVSIVKTRIVDYTVDDKTGEVVSGSKSDEKFMTYEWTLIRSKGMTTPEPAGEGSENTVSIHCPSCGAPIAINQSAKCPYCDAVISARDYDWAISAIKGLAQRTE